MIDPVAERLILFSDFDLTCTAVTSAILAEIAILTAPNVDLDEQEKLLARMSSVDLRNTWDFISAQYTEEYEQCIENILPSDKVDKFNYEYLLKALEQLSQFERRAYVRVIDSGVLKGLNFEDIKRVGEHMILQNGCKDLFKRVIKNEKLNASIHVLSYCWCADLMRSAFASGLEELTIHANEFVYEDGISTCKILRKVESPSEKAEAFKDISKTNENSKRPVTVYIGNSVIDLLCLLEADIGIVIGSSETLRRLATQFGVSLVSLFMGSNRRNSDKVVSLLVGRGYLVLSTPDSWDEIDALILDHYRI